MRRMSDDLIKRLGDPNRDWPEFGHDRREAKNLIEELKLCRIADAIVLIGEQRKLAKAVEALRKIERHCEHANYILVRFARAVLAELEVLGEHNQKQVG